MRVFITLVLLLFIFGSSVYANSSVVINEFSSATSSDWVELYNLSSATQSANLSNYKLRDSGSNEKSLSGTLDPGVIIDFSFGNYLNSAGDRVKLIKVIDNDELLVDELSYGDTGGICAPSKAEESIGRYPDGSSNIVRFAEQTRGKDNLDNLSLCPTPTPTATLTSTPTPEPTATPKPTLTPKPEPTEKPANTPTPSKIPTPTLILTSTKALEDFTEEVLGEGKEAVYVRLSPTTSRESATLSGDLVSPTATPSASFFKPWHFLLLGFSAIVAMTISAFKVNLKKKS